MGKEEADPLDAPLQICDVRKPLRGMKGRQALKDLNVGGKTSGRIVEVSLLDGVRIDIGAEVDALVPVPTMKADTGRSAPIVEGASLPYLASCHCQDISDNAARRFPVICSFTRQKIDLPDWKSVQMALRPQESGTQSLHTKGNVDLEDSDDWQPEGETQLDALLEDSEFAIQVPEQFRAGKEASAASDKVRKAWTSFMEDEVASLRHRLRCQHRLARDLETIEAELQQGNTPTVPVDLLGTLEPYLNSVVIPTHSHLDVDFGATEPTCLAHALLDLLARTPAPLFSICASEDFWDILFPNVCRPALVNMSGMSPIPWEQKLPIAFWRGTDRGAVNWDAALDASKLELQRTFCYRAAKAIERFLDAWADNDDFDMAFLDDDLLNATVVNTDPSFVPLDQWPRRRYLLDLPGNGYSGSLKQKLTASSAVLFLNDVKVHGATPVYEHYHGGLQDRLCFRSVHTDLRRYQPHHEQTPAFGPVSVRTMVVHRRPLRRESAAFKNDAAVIWLKYELLCLQSGLKKMSQVHAAIEQQLHDALQPLDNLQACDTIGGISVAVLCLLALAVCFFGYRIYKLAFAVFAFIVGFGFEAAVGSAWIAQGNEEGLTEKVIVLVCSILWGTLFLVLARRYQENVEKIIGFVFGACLGLAVTIAVLYILQAPLDKALGTKGQGWENFAGITLGVPIALLTGYLCRMLPQDLALGQSLARMHAGQLRPPGESHLQFGNFHRLGLDWLGCAVLLPTAQIRDKVFSTKHSSCCRAMRSLAGKGSRGHTALFLAQPLTAAALELRHRRGLNCSKPGAYFVRPLVAEEAKLTELRVHVLMGGFGSARLAGWSRATPTDQKELLQRLRPEVQCTFGPTPPQGTQILVLVIPFAGLPVATKNLVTDAGFIKNGLRLHNVHHNSSTTAEMAVALGLAAAKQLLPADRSLRKGDWSPRGIPSYGDPDPMFQLGLDGQTALVLGYGEVGRRVSRILAAMNMRVIATRKSGGDRQQPEPGSIVVREASALHELLPDAQSLDTPETEGLINTKELALLPDKAVIVNVGRADVINEEALYHALQDGRIMGAGVDCWYKYPPDFKSRNNTPVSEKFNFAGLDNLVMSPHRAGSVGLLATERLRMAALAELINTAVTHGFDSMPNRIDAPLIMAYLLVAEAVIHVVSVPGPKIMLFQAKIPMGDQDAYTYSGIAMQMVDELNELVKPILAETSVWPYREAIARLHATESATLEAQRTYPSLLGGPRGAISLEFAVVHCKEPLDWVEAELLGITPPGSQLTFYEKCGEEPRFSGTADYLSILQLFLHAKTNARRSDAALRCDECLGYLAHIVNNYWNLATFTVFMQADPQEHLHFSYLHNVAKMISSATYAIPFLSLNGARHVRSWTPCLNAVHEAIFGEQMRDAVGPYCCAQFVVQDAKVRERPVEFYQRMLRLVDGTLEHDLCFPGKVKRSTHCYGMEFTWHLVFGEDYETPLRQDLLSKLHAPIDR
eukprot:g32838.t1